MTNDDPNLFIENNFFIKYIYFQKPIEIILYSYLKDYYSALKLGYLKVEFYQTIYKGIPKFNQANSSYENLINLSQKYDSSFEMNGSIYIQIDQEKDFYDFSASLKHI